MEEKEIIKKLIEQKRKKNEEIYMLLRNTKAQDVELAFLKATGLEGIRAYYPDKEFEVLLEKADLATIIDRLLELNLTDYDVVFIDSIFYEDFYLLCRFLLTMTGVRTLVPNSKLRAKMESNPYKIVDKIKEKLDHNEMKLTLFDQLLLGKEVDTIKKYGEEKGYQIEWEE